MEEIILIFKNNRAVKFLSLENFFEEGDDRISISKAKNKFVKKK